MLDVLVVRRALSRRTWCNDNLPPKLFEIYFLGVFKYTECDNDGFIAKSQLYYSEILQLGQIMAVYYFLSYFSKLDQFFSKVSSANSIAYRNKNMTDRKSR